MVKDTLILINKNRDFLGKFPQVEGITMGQLGGICDIANFLFKINILSADDLKEFRIFMNDYAIENDHEVDDYWWPIFDPDRWKWLDQIIEKL